MEQRTDFNTAQGSNKQTESQGDTLPCDIFNLVAGNYRLKGWLDLMWNGLESDYYRLDFFPKWKSSRTRPPTARDPRCCRYSAKPRAADERVFSESLFLSSSHACFLFGGATFEISQMESNEVTSILYTVCRVSAMEIMADQSGSTANDRLATSSDSQPHSLHLRLCFRYMQQLTPLRFQVWVRNHSTVRSILTGFVAAFDKHLNLALVDVDEAICLPRKDDIKTSSLTPERDLKDLPVVHNEQDYLAIANADGHYADAVDERSKYKRIEECFNALAVKAEGEESNGNEGVDVGLVKERIANDTEKINSNNDVSHDHSRNENDDGTSAAAAATEAENLRNVEKKEPTDRMSTTAQTGSDLTQETMQSQRTSEECRREKNPDDGSLSKSGLPTITELVESDRGEALTNATKKNRNKSRKKSKGPGQSHTPVLSQRFIPQLFVRGEQVVMIAFADI